jgi:hypothetical protein
VAETLDEYLVQYRNENGQIAPAAPRRQRVPRWKTAKGKAKAYYLLRDTLPAAVFETAVARPYHGLRAAAGRNPGRGHVLPDFLIPGVAKCGTTSLFDWICEHPMIARPTTAGRQRKELLFFDYSYEEGTDWYRTHFPLERARREFAAEHGRPFLTGEATASYLTGHWVPARVHKLIPDVKLIVTLRNPIDRAYSAFQMSRREGLEPCESFEQAIALEAQRLQPELERTRRDPRYNPPLPPPLGYWSYLHRSRYAEHLERWLELFPLHQFHFVRFEDLVVDPQRTLDRVYEFLGLPPHQHAGFRKLNAGDYSDAVSEATRAHLREHFRPLNQRLAELTGIDFGWDA